jgi:hypothetical protein
MVGVAMCNEVSAVAVYHLSASRGVPRKGKISRPSPFTAYPRARFTSAAPFGGLSLRVQLGRECQPWIRRIDR